MSQLITVRAAGSRARVALLMLGGLVGVIGFGAASAATSESEATAIVVKYSELSLATDAGVNELYRRILYAAKMACPITSIRDLRSVRLADQCREQAVARAIRQIDNSRLAALYASNARRG